MDTTSNSVHNSHPKVNSITTDDLCKVYSETFEVRSKWQNVLLALGVGIHSIDSISKKWRDDPGDCYREGLSEWLNGGERSWEDIVHALSSPTVGSTAIASKIKKKYNRDIPKKGGDKQPLTIDRVRNMYIGYCMWRVIFAAHIMNYSVFLWLTSKLGVINIIMLAAYDLWCNIFMVWL